MIVTILLVIVNVITRKLFNYIIIWSEEIATSCFVYSVFIGAAYAYRKHQHVGVDLLVERLPAGARRVVHLITNALLVIINGYITVLSVQFISRPGSSACRSQSCRPPRSARHWSSASA